MTRLITAGILIIASIAGPSAAAAQPPARTLKLTFEADGTVTLNAASVSVREVLLEWARLCGCLIANAQNLAGTIDVPVQFDHSPQAVELGSLLRKSAGYILTPRSAGMTGPSEFETVYVLATSNPVAAPVPYSPSPSFVSPPIVQPPTAGAPADELPPLTPIPTLPGRAPSVPGAASQGGVSPPAVGVSTGVSGGPTLQGPTAPAQPIRPDRACAIDTDAVDA
jgi:hypothetical protein